MIEAKKLWLICYLTSCRIHETIKINFYIKPRSSLPEYKNKNYKKSRKKNVKQTVIFLTLKVPVVTHDTKNKIRVKRLKKPKEDIFGAKINSK